MPDQRSSHTDATGRRRAEFLGSYPCVDCASRDVKRMVRVYGWLPEAVLCASCARAISHDEDAAQTDDDDG